MQVGTLSFSHPSFGVSVVFIYLFQLIGELTLGANTERNQEACIGSRPVNFILSIRLTNKHKEIDNKGKSFPKSSDTLRCGETQGW